jgi:TRAP transporter TAXI family solute receptor
MLNLTRLVAFAAAALCAASAAAQTYGFATLPPGSLLHTQASVIAKVVQDNSKLQIRVIGYGGDSGILEAVNSKKADFLVLDVGETADAYHGRGNWKGNAKPGLRTAITMDAFQMAFWVRKDSDLRTVADLKGRRVPSGWAQQTGVIPHTIAVLASGGLTYNDVQPVPHVNVVRAAEDFKAGNLDILFFAVGAPKVAEVAAAVGGLRVLKMDPLPDSEKRMKAVRSEYYYSTAIPAPHVAGIEQPSPVQTIDVIIGVGSHVPNEVVYEFVKAMHRNKKGLAEGHPNFNRFDEKAAGKVQPTLPHHPGAIKYFKEAGIWAG